VIPLNRGDERVEEHPMHGAWAFDLLLLLLTGGITVVAFRQFTMEQDQSD
jgi:hypothetical protein